MNRRNFARKLFALPAIAALAPLPTIKTHRGNWDDILFVEMNVDDSIDAEDAQEALAELKKVVALDSGRDIRCCLTQGLKLHIHTTYGEVAAEVIEKV